MSSRPLTDEEKATGMREVLLASEGLAKNEVSRILRGEIRDWSDLSSADGASGPIAVIHHRPECGVSVTARMRFLGDMKAEMVKGEEVLTCHKVVSRGIGSGKYPYSFALRLVHRLEPSDSAAMFLDFVKSEEGRRVITEEGYILPD